MIYRNWLPVSKGLCSAELLENKYLIPCNPVEVLIARFGHQYMDPQDENFMQTSIDFGNGIKFKEEELPYVFRSYDENGRMHVNRTLTMLNLDFYLPLLNKTINKLPPDAE